jgi:hypothetical protein
MNTRLIGSAFLSLGIAGTLSGDVISSYYNSYLDYGWHIEHMPDFDQDRIGLPEANGGVPGGSYCVPTACTNLFAYMASHGFPTIGPEFADWENEEDYGDVTAFIDDLGDDMFTSATSGTNAITAYGAMLAKVLWHTGGRFTVDQEMWTPWNDVTLREMARAGINDDAIQVFSYGVYKEIGTDFWGDLVIWREGGHCMTLVGAARNGTYQNVRASDPSGGGSFLNESDFSVSTWDVALLEDVVVAPNTYLSLALPTQSMTRIMRGPLDTFRLIDSRMAVRPVGCASWGEFTGGTPVDSSAYSSTSSALVTTTVAYLSFDPLKVFKAPGGDLVFIEQTPENGLQAWFETPEHPETEAVPIPIGPLPSGVQFKDLTFSKDRTLLVVAEDLRLYCLPGFDDRGGGIDDDGNPEDYVVMSDLQGIEQIAHDTTSGTTYLLDRSTRRLLIADRDFENVIERFVPNAVPMDLPENGRLEFKADANDNLFFNVSGSNDIWMFRGDNGQAELLDQLMAADLRGFDFDDFGNLLLNDSGKVRCFSFTDDGLIETGHEGSAFAGLVVGRGLVIDRSSSNFDSKHHEEAGWQVQLYDEPCDQDNCDDDVTADLDGDGAVGGSDLGLLLAAWGGSGADINGDGSTDGADMGLLLAAWGSTQP